MWQLRARPLRCALAVGCPAGAIRWLTAAADVACGGGGGACAWRCAGRALLKICDEVFLAEIIARIAHTLPDYKRNAARTTRPAGEKTE